MIEGSDKWVVGFVDSGTTFSYIPTKMWNVLAKYFDKFCLLAKNQGDGNSHKYCPGKRFNSVASGQQVMCFAYDQKKYPNKKEFFMGFPVINIFAYDHNGEKQRIKWFPSEYLYLEDNSKYCMTADKEGTTQILFGSTLMR